MHHLPYSYCSYELVFRAVFHLECTFSIVIELLSVANYFRTDIYFSKSPERANSVILDMVLK